MNPFRMIPAALALVSPALQAADLFPLQPGATWEYRAESVAEPISIRVGLNQLYIGDGRAYSRLIGYVAEPVWVRLNDAGDLVYLNEETNEDRLLTSFQVQRDKWFPAAFRVCEQEGETHSNAVPYHGPTGRFSRTVAVRYRSSSCADSGVENEQFAANVGMVSRSVTTIAGPVLYKLVYADTGSVQAAERRASVLRLSLHPGDDDSIRAIVRLTGDYDAAPTLAFETSQEFDLLLRDTQGAVIWRWSDGRVFAPALHHREAVSLRYEAAVPRRLGGFSLPGGEYTVEAWLTTAQPGPSPRAAAKVFIDGEPTNSRMIRPFRSRSHFQNR